MIWQNPVFINLEAHKKKKTQQNWTSIYFFQYSNSMIDQATPAQVW